MARGLGRTLRTERCGETSPFPVGAAMRTFVLVPTASDYRSISSRLTVIRGQVASLLRPVVARIEPRPFDSGVDLARTVDTTMAVTSANVTALAAEIQRQIDEATRRAAVCDGYALAVREYHRSDDPGRPYPQRPATWADHGW